MGGQQLLSEGLWLFQGLAVSEKVAVHSTMEPCVLLDPHQKALYRDVMQESYDTLMSLGEDSCPFGCSDIRGGGVSEVLHRVWVL